MARAGVPVDYDAPATYDRLIAARFAPIAEALVAAAHVAPGCRVLELGAGTGLVTRLVAGRVGRDGALCATDRSVEMLAVARRAVERPNVAFVVADYDEPLPFLDDAFDRVLSGLTYVQDADEPVAEVARVTRPGGRFALTMWGPDYDEPRLLSDARVALGESAIAPPRAEDVVARLERHGFAAVERRDLDLAPRFETVDDYLEYRRGFGVPIGWTPARYDEYVAAVRAEAGRFAADDGSLQLGWAITVVTADRPGLQP